MDELSGFHCRHSWTAMPQLPYIKIPVIRTNQYYAEFNPEMRSFREILFEAKQIYPEGSYLEDSACWIYECRELGCKGCGCPPFFGMHVPDEVWDHLREHVDQRHS